MLIIASLFLFQNSDAQNLIQNNSFELNDSIDCGAGGFDNYYYSPAPHVVNNWYSYNSPDYFNSICTGWYHVPNNILGSSSAKSNNAYVGISVFQANNLEYKEYIYQNLLSPLISGKVYCLSFFISKADRKEYAVKNVGAYLCSTLPSMVSNMYINAIPQVINTNGFISDTSQWSLIQGCFTANGGEQYIIIGNFNSNDNTDTLYTGTNNPIAGDPKYAYYYIDDVNLYDQTTVGVYEINGKHKFNLFPNPNNSVMEFSYDLGSDSEAIMKLFDVTGKLICVYKLQNTQGTMSMNEQSLHNGIYFYHILVGGKTVKTDKIVIIK